MNKILLLILILLGLLQSGEVDIDCLLVDIEKKTDLSSKTKLENGGVSIVYTRDDITRMQAKTLKDILKSTYPFGYSENKYALPDPYFVDSSHPFISSSIRLYIDDQEITIGLYGSGIVLYGDIDLGFIDHIEVYSGNPTYEFSTEPTFTLIKLYSKIAQKDSGTKLSAQVGNFQDSLLSVYNSAELDNDWSYFAYTSLNNDIRKKYTSHNTELSRDKKITHLFGSFYNKNNKIMVDVGRQNKDTFIDQSLDATPLVDEMKNDYLHIGYNGSNENLSYLLSYDLLNSESKFRDDVTPLAPDYMFPISSLDVDSRSYVISGELKYNYQTNTNKFITGLKYRYKGFEYNTLLRNDADIPRTGNTNQIIYTAFIENQYSMQANSIFTTGVSASKVQNNHSEQNDDLLMYRLGHTYTTNYFIFKTIFSHVELTLDPYLVNSDNIYTTPGKKDTTKQNMFLENIIYQKNNNKYELILSLIKAKNQLIADLTTGLLDNYSQTIELASTTAMWTHNYNQFDKLYITARYNQMDNMPSIERMKQYQATIRNLNTYNKFDIFNELIYYKDDIGKTDFYDYSLGAIYHLSDDLSVSLKGINILDKAQTTTYSRISPNTFQQEESLKISPIDRHVLLSIEYLF